MRPDGTACLPLDGYRALAFNAHGRLSLYSRKRKSFNWQYQLRDLPQNSVVDGDIVALDDGGRPNFNFLQHSRSQAKHIYYFVFDLLVYDNQDLMPLPLVERREILKSVFNFESPRVRISEYFETSAHGVESVIVGYYKEPGLVYVARVRNGFVQETRRELFAKLQPIIAPDCPFVKSS